MDRTFPGRIAWLEVIAMRRFVVILAWVVATAVAGGQPPADGPRLARVEGQVVDKETKQPVPQAKVVLLQLRGRFTRVNGDLWNMPDSPPGTDPDATQMATTASSQGEFGFVVTRPTRFALFVSAPGYVRGGGMQSAFQVDEGDEVQKVTVELERETSVSGTVIDADTGRPLAGLAVTAWRYRKAGMGPLAGGGMLVREGDGVIAGKDGAFRLTGLPPDQYFLSAASPLGAKIAPAQPAEDFRRQERWAYQEIWYPGAVERRQAVPLTLSGRGVEGLEFRVSRRRVAAVRARVEAPVENLVVSVAVIRVEQELAGAKFSTVAHGEAKAGEVFEVSDLAPGRYLFSAVCEPGGAVGTLRGLLYQDVGEENIDGLVVPLSAGVEVRGRIRIAGREPKPGEAVLPADGLRVGLMQEVRTGGSPLPAEVSAKSGEFVFHHVIPDTYMAGLFGGIPGFALAEVRYNGSICPHGVFAIDSGATEHRLELTLDAQSASMAVQVSDGLRPSPRAVVLVAREPVLLRLHPDVLWPVATDEEGGVVVPNLLPGSYRVAAWRAGEPFLEDPQFADRIRNGMQARVGAGEQVRIQIRPHTVVGVSP